MRRLPITSSAAFYFILGLLCCLVALTWSSVLPITAQDEEAEYYGLRECRSCHRPIARVHAETGHGMTLQDVTDEEDKELILGDLGQELLLQFPDDSEPRQIIAEDIAFTLGSGRNLQNYLYEVDSNEYLLLPYQWDVHEQIWRPYTLAEDWPAPEFEWGPNCASCHTTGLDTERYRWEDDGVQCEACHGPGSIHVEVADDAGGSIDDDEMREILGAITLIPDAQVCAQCHSEGMATDGVHPYPVGYLPGASLTGEDGVFTLIANDDPDYWWASGHARGQNMQFNEWLESSHAESLDTLRSSDDAESSCLQCHSGDYRFNQHIRELYQDDDREVVMPDEITLDSATMGLVCITCHAPHDEDAADHLLRTGSYTLCAECHSSTTSDGEPLRINEQVHHPVREMFEGLPIVEGIEGVSSKHFSEEDGPRCASCHMTETVQVGENSFIASHLLKPIIPGTVDEIANDSCSGCHEDLTTADLQYLVDDVQEDVRSRLSVAWARLAGLGEPDTDSTERYNQIVEILTFIQNDGSLGVHNYAYTDAMLRAAETTLSNLTVNDAVAQPTEAPAPTAIPSDSDFSSLSEELPEERVISGIRPMTNIIMGLVLVVLLFAAFIFFHNPADGVE